MVNWRAVGSAISFVLIIFFAKETLAQAESVEGAEETEETPSVEEDEPGEVEEDEPGEVQEEETPPVVEEAGEAETGEKPIEEVEATGVEKTVETLPVEADEIQEEETVEKFEVTGSRIKRERRHDHGHLVVVTSDQIAMSGASNLEQLLAQFPMFTSGGQKTSHPTGEGVVTVDLRNLGPDRNLVLINGHRIVGAGGSTVDMSIIPVSAVDRVEILFGGLSAIYGAGAMTGVVNVILKKDFNGIETRVRGGITTHGDGGEVGASTTMGLSRDRGNIMLGLDWSHRSPVFQRDRSWASPPCENVFYSLDGSVQSECGSSTVPGGTYIYFGVTDPMFNVDYPSGIVIHGHGDNMIWHGMQTVYEDWLEDNPGTPYDMYNWGEQAVLSGQSDRFQATTNGEFKLTDSLIAYMDGLFAYQRHGGRWASEPVRMLESAAQRVHLSNPFIPEFFWTEILNEYGPVNEANPYIGFNKRYNDVGARVYKNTSTTFRTIAGLKGEVTDNFSWDVFADYSQYRSVNIIQNLINLENLGMALDPELCYSEPDCILANVFGEGSLQGEVRDFIGYDREETLKWHLIDAGAHVTLAPFKLQGGRFTAVVGGDFSWVLGQNIPTAETIEIDSVAAAGEYQGNYNAQEAFVELSAPFLGGLPGASLLELNMAGRFSHYSSFGNLFSMGMGLVYAPIEDIRFRGNWGTSFRVPTLQELYGDTYTYYPQLNDPCSQYMFSDDSYLISQCVEAGVPDTYVQTTYQLPAQYGANPDLGPERGQQLNLGTVFEPTFMPKRVPLVVTFDWYKIWVNGAAGAPDPQVILYNCYEVDGLQEYCDYIEREEGSGNVTLVDATLKNTNNEIEYVGIDFQATIGFPIYNKLGGSVGFHWSILRTFIEFSPDDLAAGTYPEDAEQDYAEIISPMGSGQPKHRYLLSFSLGDPIWTAATQIRYISGMDFEYMSDAAPYYRAPSIAYWDVSGQVRLSKFDLIVGIRNILDKVPPYYPGTGYNGNPNVYDFIGRYVYANLGYQFL